MTMQQLYLTVPLAPLAASIVVGLWGNRLGRAVSHWLCILGVAASMVASYFIFRDVMAGCAVRPGQGVWITGDMIDAYTRLHRLGHAHSIEVWHNDMLAGGLYGVTVGGLFAGESMFTIVPDASKVALAFVVERLRERGFQLFDVQFINDHTQRMGAIEIPRREYLRRLRRALTVDATFA